VKISEKDAVNVFETQLRQPLGFLGKQIYDAQKKIQARQGSEIEEELRGDNIFYKYEL
jgi:hypothetical protein